MSERHYGRCIGTHLGRPIYETIEQEDVTYVFDRLAQCDDDGCPLDQLAENEVLLLPGLIYKTAS